MLGGILLTRDVLEQAALGEHQLVAPIDLENLKLDTIAKRYYDDFTDIARILVMDAEHVFPKDKLPAEVHAELHETEPLSSKTSMDFKRALQAYLGQVCFTFGQAWLTFDGVWLSFDEVWLIFGQVWLNIGQVCLKIR